MVDLFGQPFDPEIMGIAKEKNLYVIEDAAQAPGASYVTKIKMPGEGNYRLEHKYTGTLGHIGCFSFTQGKHMTAGEGGMITTDDEDLAEKCRLLMNHAEAIINDRWRKFTPPESAKKLSHYWGFNMRLTEIQAAILQEQLDRVDGFIQRRVENAIYLANALKEFNFISPPKTRKDCTHTYYVQSFLFNEGLAGIHRDKFIEAVKAELMPMDGRADEGVRMGCGYIKPLYRMPLFEKAMSHTLSKKGFPIPTLEDTFPTVERLWKDELFLHLYLGMPTTKTDLDDIVDAFEKVWTHKEELR